MNKKPFLVWGFVLVFLFCIVAILYLFSPLELESEKTITIPRGYSIMQTGEKLADEGIIRSPFVFRIIAQAQKPSLKAGTYYFDQEQSVLTVIDRISHSDYGDVYISVTFPEGSTIKQMAEILEKSDLPSFSKSEFLEKTKNKQGSLFPDTYFFLPSSNTDDVIDFLESNFDKKIKELEKELNNSSRSFSDIITMASIIEKEAGNDFNQKKIVSGILWKRIDRGMLLQVDAPFLYFTGKGSAQLTTADLETDHAYNTYTRIGLPPTAIGNPGFDSIAAAISPTESLYFFYLHDNDGKIHYAKTYNGHIKNKNEYLK